MAGLPILNDKQLRELAYKIQHQEATHIHNIQFKSPADRNNYLKDSKACYESALSILDAGAGLESKYGNHVALAPISQDIGSYLIKSLNLALQTVNNYTLRINFLTKISEHSKSYITELGELDPQNATAVAQLAKKAGKSNSAMLGYIQKHKSTDSSAFSKSLRARGFTFKMLVQTYQNELGFNGPFKDLEDVQKLQVYEKIIEASGRGKTTLSRTTPSQTTPSPTEIESIFGPAEAAVLIFAAGTMVWDIFTADYVVKKVTEDAVNALAAVGGAMLGEIVVTAMAEMEVLAEASLYVVTAGILTGIGAAVVAIVSLAGILIDLIFGSGGEAPLSTDGIYCYVSPMPDGVKLARVIVASETL